MSLNPLNNIDVNSIALGIVVFNTSLGDLEECFLSIKNSSIVPNVFILCNSENEIYQIQVNELCIKYSLKYIKSENHGFGHGHNQIISLVNYEWYICCNPDIILHKNTLECLLHESQKLETPAQITPKILNPDGSIQKLSKKNLSLSSWLHRQIWRIFPHFFKPFEEKFDYSTSQRIEFVTGCFFLIKCDIYKKIGGFSKEFFLYCEDADFSRRASKYGFNYYIASTHVTHKWGKAYTKSFHYLKIELFSLFKYFRKHGFF